MSDKTKQNLKLEKKLVVFREGRLCKSLSVRAVSSRRTLAQLNHLLTYIIAPGPHPLLCVYSPNPFLQQMTGSPTEPARRFQLSCITMRAHPIMQREKEANLVAALLSTQRQLQRLHSADLASCGGAGHGCYITGWAWSRRGLRRGVSGEWTQDLQTNR